MLRATGVDLGSTGTRRVSVGLLWGAPRVDGREGGPSVANVPSDRLTFRRLGLPPVGRDVRARVVSEELSYSLPFPLDEAAWDWTEADDVACVLVAPRARLEELRRPLGDRVALDAEPLSYLRAARAARMEDALVVDLGASRTTLCAMKDGSLDWVRVFFRGGEALTRRLASARGLPEAEAEDLKRREGMRLPECREWLAEILEETLLPRPLPFEHVLVCGGGAAMPGLLEALAERLDHPAEIFPVPEPLSPYRDVAAYGAALALRPGWPRVQLRPATRAEGGLKPLYAVWLVLLLLMASADLEIRHSTTQRRFQERRDLLQAAVRIQAPALAETPSDQLAQILGARVDSAREVQRLAPETLVSTLSQMARPIREQRGLEVRAVSVDQGKVTLDGQATGLPQLEQFRQHLAGILDDVEQVNMKPSATGRVTFSLEGKLQQP